MPKHEIVFTEEARQDLLHYAAYERKIIVSEIRTQLTPRPREETKNRKQLQENPIASWELRAGKFRIFYQLAKSEVCIIAVGHKQRNRLFIRGKEVQL
jgi:mRNA-degrading endonuclease RelE of RelBE toxin-antitoxin system